MTIVPGHIEKTLAKLRAQIEKAKIEGAYTVSSQGVTYTIGEQSQIPNYGPATRNSYRDTWEDKVAHQLLKEDFTLLYAEAQSLAQQEIEEVLGVIPLTGAR
ncbi:200_t:CDS:2 [Gigaspora margarita]|uniref:200_t:CDS:1 n=1 Tax=Gigaspora margarita TaxID=4874 RepID=A0ABN7VC03_GIGMA|nr:200_t:CDS:2 [Gigaspora margarita]